MQYYNFRTGQNQGTQLSRRQIFIRAIVLTTIVIVVGLIYVLFDIRSTSETKLGKQTVATNDTFTQFTTEYFTFRAADSWKFVQEFSTDKSFMYRKSLGSTDTAVFTVNIDQPIVPESRRVQYIVPFAQDPDTLKLTKKDVSPACRTLMEDKINYPLTITGNVNVKIMTYEGASFACWTDNPRAILSASIVGGDDIMKLTRPDGSTHTYRLQYEDVRSESLQYSLDSMIFESFEVK